MTRAAAVEPRQPPGADRCFLCGVPEVSPQAPYGSPLCGRCIPACEHVVSMTIGPNGERLATCQCGWRDAVARPHQAVQEARIRQHWLGAIRRKWAEFDAEFGAGAAAREFAGFALAAAIGANATVAIALIADALGVWS